MDRELNINLSETLLKTVRDSYEIFKAGRKQNKVHKAFRNDGSNVQSSQLIDFEHMASVQEQDEVSDSGEEKASKTLKSEKDSVVTPYAIKNLTEAEIIIEKEADMESIRR